MTQFAVNFQTARIKSIKRGGNDGTFWGKGEMDMIREKVKPLMSLHMESPAGAQKIFNGQKMDYFGGTGYLLHNHPAVLQAAQEALQRYGFSTATSRAVMASTRCMMN